MVDLPSWAPLPEHFADRPYHAHNRLIGSITTDTEGRRKSARTIAYTLERSAAPVALILPSADVEE